MIRIVIASSDQALVFQLRSVIEEMDGVRVEHVAYSTDDLAGATVRLDPDVLLVHDLLGPTPVMQMVRDLGLRRPSSAAVIVSSGPPTAEFLTAAMAAGVRGITTLPVSFEDLRTRIEAAAESGATMRALMVSAQHHPGEVTGTARVVAVAGAKGGTGVTTVATHLALDLARRERGRRTCLVDLDLEKGDVAAVIDVRHRASVADVAKVADDLSARAVTDAVVLHASGVYLLLAPNDVRDVEAVTPQALREVLAVLRQEFDLVILDVGSHVTPAQAAAVELADEVLMVTTPDVAALRGLRRTISQWEQLAVRKESDIRVLVNRVSRQSSVSPDAVRQLTRAPLTQASIPAMFRRLEPALNARDPFAVREQAWWRAIRALQEELGLTAPRAQPAGRRGSADPGADRPPPARGRKRGRRDDRGSVSLELVGILPFVLLVVALCWQLGLYGMSAVWMGHAASAAARAQSVGADPAAAARAALPGSVAGAISVDSGGSSVTVRMRVPLFAPGLGSLPSEVSETRQVVREP